VSRAEQQADVAARRRIVALELSGLPLVRLDEILSRDRHEASSRVHVESATLHEQRDEIVLSLSENVP
jgi:hypothetical protein